MTEIFHLLTKIYKITPDSFIKSEYAECDRPKNIHGNPIVWRCGAQRLQNEAAALQLLAQRTTIRVPKLYRCEQDDKGATYLEVERIHGLEFCDVQKQCRLPAEQAHVVEGECVECRKIAVANVDKYIQSQVIPQLHSLRSNRTGLNGFVLPPPRIEQADKRETWHSKQSSNGDEYVFCHGDLSYFNIILDPQTLEVKVIIDWEQAGYFPPVLERPLWLLDNDGYMKIFTDMAEIQKEIVLIE